MDFVRLGSPRTEVPAARFIGWFGVPRVQLDDGQTRDGKGNEHHALVPRDHWNEDGQRAAVVAFHAKRMLEGGRRPTFMMPDADIVASPMTTRPVLAEAGVIDRRKVRPSGTGEGFDPPRKPHPHGHIDIDDIGDSGTFDHLCTALDGRGRAVPHGDIPGPMSEREVECVVPRRGRARRSASHRRRACRRPAPSFSAFAEHDDARRLHSAIGDVTPPDVLAGRREAIHADRDRQLEAARERRALRRQRLRPRFVSSPAELPASPAGTRHSSTPSVWFTLGQSSGRRRNVVGPACGEPPAAAEGRRGSPRDAGGRDRGTAVSPSRGEWLPSRELATKQAE